MRFEHRGKTKLKIGLTEGIPNVSKSVYSNVVYRIKFGFAEFHSSNEMPYTKKLSIISKRDFLHFMSFSYHKTSKGNLAYI